MFFLGKPGGFFLAEKDKKNTISGEAKSRTSNLKKNPHDNSIGIFCAIFLMKISLS